MRTLEEIKKEHADLCMQAGYVQYQIFAQKITLHDLNDRILKLNQEAHPLQEEELKKKSEDS